MRATGDVGRRASWARGGSSAMARQTDRQHLSARSTNTATRKQGKSTWRRVRPSWKKEVRYVCLFDRCPSQATAHGGSETTSFTAENSDCQVHEETVLQRNGLVQAG